MRALGQWIFSVAAAGIVTALLASVSPEKSRPVIRFAGGLLMILTALSPIRSVSVADAPSQIRTGVDGLADRLTSLCGDADDAGMALMLREAERYLAERLSSVGCPCEVRLTAGDDGAGVTVFRSATVTVEKLPEPSVLSDAAEIIVSQTGVQPVFREKGGTE